MIIMTHRDGNNHAFSDSDVHLQSKQSVHAGQLNQITQSRHNAQSASENETLKRKTYCLSEYVLARIVKY